MVLRILLILGILTLLSPVLVGVFGTRFGSINFWQVHGVFYLICIFFFPRLTLLFSSAWGSLLAWLGWFFCPRYLIAILATIAYWDTNPLLVSFAWLNAIGGESAEKFVVHRKIIRVKKMDHQTRQDDVIDI